MPDANEIMEARARINPTAPLLSDQQHREAAVRYYFDEYIGDSLYAVDIAVKLLARFADQIATDPELEKDYRYFLRRAEGAAAQFEIEDIVAHSVEKVGPYLRNGLMASHCGDCTAHPATCTRCWAEGYYDIPSSKSWSGKHEGWRLFHLAQAGEK